MAEQPTAEELKLLKSKKLKLTLDEYYEQYVCNDTANPDSGRKPNRSYTVFDKNIMDLTLDEYYEQFVQPKQLAQHSDAEVEKDQKNGHFQRTHYFAPSYLEMRQPKQPGVQLPRGTAENRKN